MEIFTCQTHFQFLRTVFNSKNSERGLLSRASEALGVHPSYLSRAIKGENNLTPDQGFTLGEFLGLDENEKEFLFILIQRDRAGSQKFKEELSRKLERIKDDKNDLGRDFNSPNTPSIIEATYYSSWMYSAIHILLSIEEYNSVAKISKALWISEKEVEKKLNALEGMGLVEQKKSNWILTNKKLFISNVSPFAHSYHTSWSNRINSTFATIDSKDIRYTGVHSISSSDWEKLKEMIRNFLKSLNPVIEPSKEEVLVVVRVDAGKLI